MSEMDNASNAAIHDLKWIEADFSMSPAYKDMPCKFQFSKLKLYRVREITFEKDSPREEALANVFTSVAIPGVNLIYLLLGDKNAVEIYFGVVEDEVDKLKGLNISNVGDDILLRSLKGNFRGSTIEPVENEELRSIYGRVFPSELGDNSSKVLYRTMDGVPGLTKDKETQSFRGMDRLIDVMLGDKFALMILAKPIDCRGKEMAKLESNLDEIYRKLAWASKCNYQRSENSAVNNGTTFSEGVSDGVAETVNTSKSQTDSASWQDSVSKSSSASSKGKSVSEQGGWSQQSGLSVSETSSANRGTTRGLATQCGMQSGTSKSWGNEIVFKHVNAWLKYFDDLIYPRLDCAKGRGLFVVSTVLASPSISVLTKLANVMKSLYAGTEGNMVPFRDETLEVNDTDAKWRCLAALQQPMWQSVDKAPAADDKSLANHREFAYARSKCANGQSEFYDGTWMSTTALSHIAGLPRKEVIGVRLREEVEFGLNVDSACRNPVPLGCLVQGGEEKEEIQVCLDKADFNKHIFVAGVTGSGKTTTCQQLLCKYVEDNDGKGPSEQKHFLVIEPAKTEYRSLVGSPQLKGLSNDLLVFTLGNEATGAPFRLNPLEFFEGESISARVDMLMASMSAAFDMEAAIPQILEQSIYRAYEDYGWDKNTNRNRHYPGNEAFKPGVYAFPCLSDVVRIAVKCVDELFPGADKRLHDEYVGSIKARLGGLLVGAKGRMLDCKRSMDFERLLDRNVVLELEEIRNGQQKALVIGFILTNLLVTIKRKFDRDNRKIGHVTLIEEAHRLMSRYEPGDDPNKRMAVETFSDMLAEVRKYGESIIIADQIPNKLTPEVLKNTNTKIVHKIFAQDDKDVVGATMALSDEQKDFLSKLKVGRAVVFSGDWSKAIHAKIPKIIDTSEERRVTNEELRKRAFDFFAQQYAAGVFPGLERAECAEKAKSIINAYWNDVLSVDFDGVFEDEILGGPTGQNGKRRELVKKAVDTCGIEVVAAALTARYLLPPDHVEEIQEAARKALTLFADGEQKYPREVKNVLGRFLCR